MTSRRTRVIGWGIVGCILGLGILGCLLFLSCGSWAGLGPDAEDALEANLIGDEFLEIYEKDNTNNEFRFAIYGIMPQHRVTIYGVVDVAEQDRILEILAAIKQEYATRPLAVSFYEVVVGNDLVLLRREIVE